jgi:hypothetical protein
MKTALHVLLWDLVLRNRVVFPALAVLLVLGAAVAYCCGHAAPDAWWLGKARGVVACSFLASVLLGVAPFLLMESQGGWRMNSAITRWFALPVRTAYLVLLPLLAAVVFLTLLVQAWGLILDRVARGFDGTYFNCALLLGLAALQALAWAVPRQPAQYWAGAALLFPVIIVLAIGPQDQPDTAAFRRGMPLPAAIGVVCFAAFALYAARRNRCGDWQGEFPLSRLWLFVRQGRPSNRIFRSSGSALFFSDGLPALRMLLFSWLTLVAIIAVNVVLMFKRGRPEVAFQPGVFALVAVNLLPIPAVLWLAGWGLFLGCEPAAGFRTRMTAFRATLPVSCGTLAAQRMVTLLLGWCLLWLPLLLATRWYDPDLLGMPAPDAQTQALASILRLMALGAHILVGVLPLFLWGRLEGFPNMLLAAIGSWVWVWLLAAFFKLDDGQDPGWRWGVVALLLGVKLATAAWALVVGLHARHLTWRFVMGLVAGWLLVVTCLVWALPTGRTDGAWRAAAMLVLVPLARLALCPLALAANRHR